MPHRRPTSLLPLLVLLAIAATLLACGGGGTAPSGDPLVPGTPAPPSGSMARWSDPASWPGGVLPQAGDSVVIPAGQTRLLDVSPPPLAHMVVDGTLRFDRRDLELVTGRILVRGAFEIGTEQQPFLQRAVITLTGPDEGRALHGMGDKFLGVHGGRLDLHGEPGRTAWTRLTAHAPRGATQITVERADGWRAGDRLVIASTDFDPLQAEEVTVASVQGTTLTLAAPLAHAHWGALQRIGGVTLDERAEVGLLTRNVTIRGDSASSAATGFGGHIMIMNGGTARVERVELVRMGQRGRNGRYPIHWHMMGDVSGQYVRETSIWRSNSRCVTVHGTNRLAVERNVCHDHAGHGYFLEDGGETGNQLLGNLGLLTRTVSGTHALLPSDDRAATFWVTNPDNVLRGNVAAGSQGFGFWYALPASPTGLSSGSAARPRHTPLGEFRDNVAHSNRRDGLFVDSGPRADLTTETTFWSPRSNPADPQSAPVTAVFRNLVAYKHGGRAVWLRGRDQVLEGGVLADNRIGATFANSETLVRDAVFIGESDNRATPMPGGTSPVRGYEFYDGRVGAERVRFVNYAGAGRPWSALGYLTANGFVVHGDNWAEGLAFENANRVWLVAPAADRDGDKAAVFRDRDGSVTGTAGAWVVPAQPIQLGPACMARPEWNAHVCTHRMSAFWISSESGEAIAPLSIRRDDGATLALAGQSGSTTFAFSTLPVNRAYTLTLPSPVPARLRLWWHQLGAGDAVRLTLPWPDRPGTLTVYRDWWAGNAVQPAASAAEVDAAPGDRYFHDRANGLLHLRVVPRGTNSWATVHVEVR